MKLAQFFLVLLTSAPLYRCTAQSSSGFNFNQTSYSVRGGDIVNVTVTSSNLTVEVTLFVSFTPEVVTTCLGQGLQCEDPFTLSPTSPSHTLHISTPHNFQEFVVELFFFDDSSGFISSVYPIATVTVTMVQEVATSSVMLQRPCSVVVSSETMTSLAMTSLTDGLSSTTEHFVTSSAFPRTSLATVSPVTSSVTVPPVTSSVPIPPVTSSITAPPVTSSATVSPVTSSMMPPVTSSVAVSPVTSSATVSPVTSSVSPVTSSATVSPVTSSVTVSPVTSSAMMPPMTSLIVTSSVTMPPVTSSAAVPPVTSSATVSAVTSSTVSAVTSLVSVPPITSIKTVPPVTSSTVLSVMSSISLSLVATSSEAVSMPLSSNIGLTTTEKGYTTSSISTLPSTPQAQPTTTETTPPSSQDSGNVGVTVAVSIIIVLLLLAIVAVVVVIVVLVIVRKKRRTHTYYTAGNKFNHYIDVQVRTEEEIREKTPESKDTQLLETSFVGNGNRGSTTLLGDAYGTLSFKGELAVAIKAHSQGSQLDSVPQTNGGKVEVTNGNTPSTREE